jgi:hypothetical protein
MTVVRGIAVMFDAGPNQCGTVEVAMADRGDTLDCRYLRGCDQAPHLIWLGKVGLCEDHILRMWPEGGVRN